MDNPVNAHRGPVAATVTSTTTATGAMASRSSRHLHLVRNASASSRGPVSRVETTSVRMVGSPGNLRIVRRQLSVYAHPLIRVACARSIVAPSRVTAMLLPVAKAVSVTISGRVHYAICANSPTSQVRIIRYVTATRTISGLSVYIVHAALLARSTRPLASACVAASLAWTWRSIIVPLDAVLMDIRPRRYWHVYAILATCLMFLTQTTLLHAFRTA